MENDLLDEFIKAHRRSNKRAFEIAVRTGTSLIFMEDGKIIEEKPPYRYVLLPIKRPKKRKSSSRKSR